MNSLFVVIGLCSGDYDEEGRSALIIASPFKETAESIANELNNLIDQCTDRIREPHHSEDIIRHEKVRRRNPLHHSSDPFKYIVSEVKFISRV